MRTPPPLAGALLLALITGCQHEEAHPAHSHHRFDDPERWARQWDDPARDRWQMPDHVLDLMAVAPGQTVVDLGAGTGYFAVRLARAVGPEGRVVALDIEPSMIEYLAARAEGEGLSNVEARVVRPDDPGLADASIDRILIVNTWHHIADRPAYTARLARALAPGGRVVIVDYHRQSEHGPPPAERLTAEEVVAELAAGGLTARILDEDLPEQYVVEGSRP